MANPIFQTRTPLTFQDLIAIRFFYLAKRVGHSLPFHRVGWKSQQTQEARFNALLAIGDLKGKSILDLGCGLGCLYGYLKEQEWYGNYAGIDLLEIMVKGARERFPEVPFEKRNIFLDPPRGQWDYVMISGMFNQRVKNNWAWIEETVRLCWGLSRLGVAFNLLETSGDEYDPCFFYAKRQDLEQKAASWSGGNYKIVAGYLPDDMTAYLYH